jgi:hypothetical protein
MEQYDYGPQMEPILEPMMDPIMDPMMELEMEPSKWWWVRWLVGIIVVGIIIILIVMRNYYPKSCEESFDKYLEGVFNNSFDLAYSSCTDDSNDDSNNNSTESSTITTRTPISNLTAVSLSANDKCLRIGDTASGTIPELYDCNGSDEQIFYFDKASNTVIPKKNINSTLHIKNDDASINQIVDIDIWKSGNTSQQFSYVNNELQSIKNPALCIDFKSNQGTLNTCDKNMQSQKILMDKIYYTKPSYKVGGNLSDNTMMGIGIGVAIGTEAMTMIIKRKLLPKLVAKTASLFKKGGLKLAYLSIKKSLSSAGIKMSQKLAMLLGKKMGEASTIKVAEVASSKAASSGVAAAAKAGATIGKVGNAAMAIFSVTSILMDVLDVAGYGKLKTKKELIGIKLELEKELLEAFNEAKLLNPMIVGPLDKFTEEEMTDLLLKKVEFIFNPDNKADDSLIKPVIDKINQDLAAGIIIKGDLNSDTKLQPYIDMVDAEKLADLVKKYVCIDKGGKTVTIPNRELMCSYKDADSCHKSYSWPPTENDTYAEFRSKEYDGSCQVYTPAMRGMCEESNIPYNYDTKICDITKEYCAKKGAEWRKDDSINDYDCNIPTEQAVLEAVFGTTVVRGVKQIADPDQYKECEYNSGEVDYGDPKLIALLMSGTPMGLVGAAADLAFGLTPKGKGYFCKSKKCPKKGRLRSKTGKCVDLPNGKTDNGTQPGMWECNGSDAQNFLSYSSDNFIRSQTNTDKCFDIPGGNANEGQLLQMWNCNYSDAQAFTYDKDTQMFHVKGKPTLCIDSIGDNQKLGLAKCDTKSKSQKFTNGDIQMEADLIGGLCWNECPPNYTSDENAICYQNCPRYGEIKVDGKCVDLPNGIVSNGAVPQLWDCNNSMAQKFYFNTDTETISPVGHEDKCFDVPNGNYEEFQKIQLWDCNGSAAQKFFYDKNTSMFRLKEDPSLILSFNPDLSAPVPIISRPVENIYEDVPILTEDPIDYNFNFRNFNQFQFTQSEFTPDNNKSGFISNNGEQLRLSKVNPTSTKQKFEMEAATNMGLTCNIDSRAADCPESYTNNGLTCGRSASNYVPDGGNSILADCPDGYTNNGATCGRGADSYNAYDNWDDRYWTGDCPPGYYNNGTQCITESFWRRSHSTTAGCEEMWGRGNCDVNCSICLDYPKCQHLARQKGYRDPDSWNTGMGSEGSTCSSSHFALNFDEHLKCPPAGHPNHTHKIGALCYIKCKDGYYNNGTQCMRDADTLWDTSYMKCNDPKFPDKIGGRCYAKCKPGYKQNLTSCWRDVDTLWSTDYMSCSQPDEHLDKATGRCYKNPPGGFTNRGLFMDFNKGVKVRGHPIPRIHLKPKERKIELSTADN